jgi:HSP20 family molecular chaperone IbpA
MRTGNFQQETPAAGNVRHLRQEILSEISGGCMPTHSRQLRPFLSDGEDSDGGNCHTSRDLNLTSLARRFGSLFKHRWLTDLGSQRKLHSQPALNPACDFLECEHEYMVTAHLAEVGHDQVIAMVNGDVLTISAELTSEFEENNKEKHYHRLTSQHSSFLLNFTLPEDVVSEAASMEFKGDLLIVHLPRREKPRTRMTDVEAH